MRAATKFAQRIVALALIFAFGHSSHAASLVHKRAPEFVRPGLHGGVVDLKAYRGKVVLLNFWATWCAPCQVEMPVFKNWQQKYASQGLQIVGISMDDDAAPVRKVLNKLRLNYPVAMGDATLGRLYGGVLGLPLTYLVGRDGTVLAQFEGETNLKLIEAQIKPLLAHH